MISRVIGTLLLFALLWVVVAIYTSLVALQGHVDDAWQEIEQQLERRRDIVPDLLVTMRHLAATEWNTVEAVAFAHAIAVAAETPGERFQSDDELSAALEELFATGEAHPEVASNQKFIQIRALFRDSDAKLASARDEYDRAVLKYNNGIQTFPGNILAGVFQFKERSDLATLLAQ